MNKGKRINTLPPGEQLMGDIFVVSDVEEVNTGGYRFIALSLSDASGRRKATYDKIKPPAPLLLYQARLIRVFGFVQTKEKYRGQIKIDSFESVAQPADLTPYVPPLPAEAKTHQARFLTLINSVREPSLRRLLHTLFDPQHDLGKRFRSAVAAQGFHHAYPGGLLEHSAEVAELCDRVCTVLPTLRRDFLVTCALLHDVGKLNEMEHGLGVGRYTESGTLVGHVFSGAYLVRAAADGILDFPPVLKDALVHLILSHHSRPEYGAARVPACAEAHVLAECDMMSARVNECCHAASAVRATSLEGVFSTRLRSGEHLHIGSLGMQEPLGTNLPLGSPAEQEPVPGFTTETQINSAPASSALQPPANAAVPSVMTFQSTVSLPVRGRVAAGSPGMSAPEEGEVQEVVLPPGGGDYLLHVTGESMVRAGILDGDLLFVQSTGSVRDGDIVVAHLPGEGEVVKRLQHPAGATEARLLSENPDCRYPPILLGEDFRIQGKVTGLLRDFR